jgi:acetate---CoA ligase (ADP-forming) subunit beta
MLRQAGPGKRSLLTEVEAKELLRKDGMPVIDTRLARTGKEAVSLSREMGFPVAMKIISPDIVHKTDAGGVKLGLANAAQVEKAYHDIMSSVRQKAPQAQIEGVSVQKMARPGIELIIGMNKDEQFGPVIMFGLGGIFVEILKDVSFRLVPLTPGDAAEMVAEIKGFRLLQGFRGQEPVNISLLEDLIVNISEFIDKNPQIKELDLNPVFGYRDSLAIVDARIILEP